MATSARHSSSDSYTSDRTIQRNERNGYNGRRHSRTPLNSYNRNNGDSGENGVNGRYNGYNGGGGGSYDNGDISIRNCWPPREWKSFTEIKFKVSNVHPKAEVTDLREYFVSYGNVYK